MAKIKTLPKLYPIKGLKNYMITEDGDVYCFRELKKMITANNHEVEVGLYDPLYGKRTVKIQRLIAETFIPNPNKLPIVMHIDGNKLNNKVSNLKWVDYCDRVQPPIRKPDTKLNSKTVLKIRSEYEKAHQEEICH